MCECLLHASSRCGGTRPKKSPHEEGFANCEVACNLRSDILLILFLCHNHAHEAEKPQCLGINIAKCALQVSLDFIELSQNNLVRAPLGSIRPQGRHLTILVQRAVLFNRRP